MRRFSTTALVGLAMLALLVGPVPAASASAETMTLKRSAGYYAKHACHFNLATDEIQGVVVNRKRHYQYRAFTPSRMKKIRIGATDMSRAAHRFARRLESPPKAWPGETLPRWVERLAKSGRRDARLFERMSVATRPGQVMRLWESSVHLSERQAPGVRRIRGALDLPDAPTGLGC